METSLLEKDLEQSPKGCRGVGAVEPERNHGIDLLKVLAIFMVVILHVLGQGGVIGATRYPAGSHLMSWWLEIESYGAVNCFAIATGFLMVGRKIKYRRLVGLWVTVQFYNLAFYLFYQLYQVPGVTLQDVSNFFPVYTGQFWYFTAYTGLFLFMPFLNILIEKLTKKQMYLLLLTGFVLFSFYLCFFGFEPFGMVGGYSVWWLMYLYFVGASIAKHKLLRKTPLWGCLIGYVTCVALTFGVRMLLSYAYTMKAGDLRDLLIVYAQPHINYNAPLMLFGAMFLVVFCLNLPIPKRMGKVLALLQPFVFQIYIIHLHPVIWKGVILDRFVSFAKKPWYTLPLWVGGAAAGIFLFCLAIDVLRHWLFKLGRVYWLIETAANKGNGLYLKSKLKKKVDRYFE